jgi:hypothetical protein
MPKKSRKNEFDAPVIRVKLQKGLADRQMLPLDHVLRVLEEVRQMVLDAGKEIQRGAGMEHPTAEFGLELLAGDKGIAFKGGSVEAQIAITSNTRDGLLAAQRIVHTVNALRAKQYIPETEADRSIVRRLNRVAQIQQTDKTELQLAVAKPGTKKVQEAIFGEAAAAVAWSIQAPVFQMEDMVLYGKLYELRDRAADDEGNRGFFGELRRENGDVWRVVFKAKDVDRVASLFRKQVSIRGTAKYYRIAAPRLLAEEINPDQERDYEAAFDELYGCDAEVNRESEGQH